MRLRTEMPELDFPPQTPNSSTTLGNGQQRPPASCRKAEFLAKMQYTYTHINICIKVVPAY